MTELTFISNGFYIGFPSWKHNTGTVIYYIRWNSFGYWEFINWPYDGEPRSYTSFASFPTTGWQLYNNINPANFNVTEGAC